MNSDGTYELDELRDYYTSRGRTVAQADAVYRRIHGQLPEGWWIRPPDPARPPPRAWITPTKPPPCRRLTPAIPERRTA